jgi:hypothetical protein
MGAFNTLNAQTSCPICGRTGIFDIQFKYGHTWQLDYEIGDRLRWGGNDKGIPGHTKVLVEGIGGPCPHCGAEFVEVAILAENDILKAAIPLHHWTTSTEEGYTVLEP